MPTRPRSSQWFEYLYFLRFSILSWLFLLVLALLDWGNVTSSITRGILTLDSGSQAFYAAFFVVALHMTALITARNITRNGEARFLTPAPPLLDHALTSSSTPVVWIALAVSQIPTVFILWYLAHNASIETQKYVLFGTHTYNIWFFFLAGTLAALLFWYLVSLFYYWTYRPSPANPSPTPAALIFPSCMFGDIADAEPPARLAAFIKSVTAVVLKHIACDGYAKTPTDPLWELHFLSTVSLIGIFLLYLFLYPLTGPVASSNIALYGQISLSLVITAVFLAAIADAGYESSKPGVPCKWARRVKWTFILLALILAALFIFALVYDHNTHSVRLEMAFPTFGSILVLAGFLLWFFSGAAFFLDRYRVPVLTTVLAIIFVPKLITPHVSESLVKNHHPRLAQIFDFDHYYTVQRLDAPVDLNKVLTPKEVLDSRAPDVEEPYIIVTASGGGIQAAEWTSQVLANLESSFALQPALLDKKPYTFHEHLVLASGVSGGSVGLMPFLLEYTAPDKEHPGTTSFPTQPITVVSEKPNTADPKQLTLTDRITGPSACSSLEAVGWGLAYHDLYRLITPIRIPGLRPDYLTADTSPDRSWALATAFNRNLHDEHCKTNLERFTDLPPITDGEGLTLKTGAEMLAKGRLPAFTFNTTAAETGSRFLLSNYRVPRPPVLSVPLPNDPKPILMTDFIPAESFLQAYASDGVANSNPSVKPLLYADLSLATAARLSATFPIVSSGTRIPPGYTAHAYHFLDGGYFDNDGTASVIEFLKSALGDDPDNERKLKLLLIEIRDDDGQVVTTDSDDLTHQNESVGNSLKAPSWTPLTQLTGIVGGLWNAGHVSIARRNRRELCVFERAHPKLEIHHIVFTIPNGADKISPLSWNLTSGQLASITDRIATAETKEAIAKSIEWVKNARQNKSNNADASSDVCRAWVEPNSSTTIRPVKP
jgi:hypothetical protein